MGAPLGASDRVGRDTDVTRPTSDRFADNYKPRNASAFVYALIAFLLVAVCCIMFSFAIGSDNVASALPLAQDYLSQESAETILRIGLGMLLPCALLLSIEIWLRHFMPMRHEVINDFVRGMQNCGVIPPDLKTDEIKWRVRIHRFKRKAYIWFWVRYPSRSYEDMLPMVAGVRTAFRRSVRVRPDRADEPYTMALSIEYGGANDG